MHNYMKHFSVRISVVLFAGIFAFSAFFIFTRQPQAQTNRSALSSPSAAAADGAFYVQQGKLTAADGAAQDSSGFAVAISGDTAVVGAPRNTGGTGLQQRGSAYVYVRDSAGVWTPQQKFAPSDGAATDQFGYAVAVDGNTIAVGRYNTTTGQNRADGKVYIFTRTGSTWTETQTLVSSDLAQGDSFGYSLALENNTLLVGARNKADGATFFKGAAYVFTRSAPGANFAQQAKLTGSDTGFSDFFGESVALSGDTAIVGSVTDFGTPNNNGKAYVFVRSGSAWSEQQILQAQNGSPNGSFGVSVSVSGDTALVGARSEVVNSSTGELGAAYVFQRNGAVWTQTQRFTAKEVTPRNDQFGYTVAVKGDTLAIGSPAHEIVSGIANHGAVYVYQRTGGEWGRTQKIFHDDPAPDALGQALAFDGDSIIAGAPAKNSARGAAYVFKSVSTGGQFKVQPAEVFSNALFGFWLGMSEETMAIGSNFGTYVYTRRGAAWEFTQRLGLFTENNGANNILPGTGAVFSGDMMIVSAAGARINNVGSRGAVLVYRRNPEGVWVEQQRLLASDGAGGDQFGSSLAVSGDTLVVGAENKTVGGIATHGAAYVFVYDGATWTEQQRLTASDGAAGDGFGDETAISGDTIVVGTPTKTVGANGMEGAAYVFKRSGATWSQQQRLTASDGGFAAKLGSSLAIEGDTIVAGASGAAVGSNTFQGAAYVFTRSGAVWSEQQKLFDANGAGGDNFAIDVALNGDQLYIGANGAGYGESIANLGAVYVYARAGGSWQKRGKLFPYDKDRSKGLGYRVAFAGNYLAATATSDATNGLSNTGSAYVFNLAQLSFSKPELDFDGDGKSDLAVFRPSESNWYLMNSTGGFGAVRFGLAGDKFVPADYDGDGKTDIAVWRDGRFYILQSSNLAVREEDFGMAGDNPAFTGDWDGDGRADTAVYRASTNHFYYRGTLNNPSGNITYLPWGAPGDKPVRGDFDGDGKLDAAVFRPANSVWYILQSSNAEVRYDYWGLGTDKFVPADYDGDGRTDLAVFRSGVWYIKQSSNNQPRYEYFGSETDALVPADYDGDGKADIAVLRGGVWYILQSANSQIAYRYFGAASDVAVASGFGQ
ncbi:MAG TPA: FG-GAP-like repeat-containing protein [Pyrinomonadaceae bacterium]|jgi:hypothetical protein